MLTNKQQQLVVHEKYDRTFSASFLSSRIRTTMSLIRPSFKSGHRHPWKKNVFFEKNEIDICIFLFHNFSPYARREKKKKKEEEEKITQNVRIVVRELEGNRSLLLNWLTLDREEIFHN